MSSSELTKWQAFDSIAPIGQERLDLLIGSLTCAVVNAFRDSSKSRPVEPADLMPFVSGLARVSEPEVQSIEDQKQIFRDLAAMMSNRASP